MPGRKEEHRTEERFGNGRDRPDGGDPAGGGAPASTGIRFHYNRDERLKNLRTSADKQPRRKWQHPIANKKSKRLFILIANVALIYGIVFSFVKPSTVYMRQSDREYEFELNVTALRGRKTLVGLTVRNEKEDNLAFRDSVPVQLSIIGRSVEPITSIKYIDGGTVLTPGESTSVVFVFEADELPRTADLEIFFDDRVDPLFRKNVRF
jgi:hypothetical protein